VNVDDADDAVARSDAAGGSTVMAPLDVTDAGLMAVVADPLGASIGIWQPGEHLGAQIVNEPVSYVWSSLHTTNLDRAVPFYVDVFGWGHGEDIAHGTTFTVGGRAVCGAVPMSGADPGGTAPYWDAYFAVGDAHATAARISELGGEVLAGPLDNGGDLLVPAADPLGARFGVAQIEAT
jgi:predicted enzyme related to lactoylglutathione lyase